MESDSLPSHLRCRTCDRDFAIVVSTGSDRTREKPVTSGTGTGRTHERLLYTEANPNVLLHDS